MAAGSLALSVSIVMEAWDVEAVHVNSSVLSDALGVTVASLDQNTSTHNQTQNVLQNVVVTTPCNPGYCAASGVLNPLLSCSDDFHAAGALHSLW